MADPSTDPVMAQILALQQQVQKLAAQQAEPDPSPPPEIHLTITLPPLELHVANDVQPAPVHVSNDVHPAAPAPATVHMAATPPAVRVTVPSGTREVVFQRDEHGMITGATVKEIGKRG